MRLSRIGAPLARAGTMVRSGPKHRGPAVETGAVPLAGPVVSMRAGDVVEPEMDGLGRQRQEVGPA